MNSKIATEDYVLEIRAQKYPLEMAAKVLLEQTGINTYPINVWEIARKLGFKIFDAKFDDKNVSGMMFDKSETPDVLIDIDKEAKRAIILNKAESKENQAFTVAHEIGHFVLHVDETNDFFEAFHVTREKDENQLTEQEKTKKIQEDVADKFAAMLLMPSDVFKYHIETSPNKNNRETLEKELSEAFLVSSKAVKKRFEELEINL